MRSQLACRAHQRLHVCGTVRRFGCRPLLPNIYQQTVLLADVALADGTPLCAHMWMPYGVRLAALDLKPGDRICFHARVRPYLKHHLVQRRCGSLKRIRATEDYKLVYPTRVTRLRDW